MPLASDIATTVELIASSWPPKSLCSILLCLAVLNGKDVSLIKCIGLTTEKVKKNYTNVGHKLGDFYQSKIILYLFIYDRFHVAQLLVYLI